VAATAYCLAEKLFIFYAFTIRCCENVCLLELYHVCILGTAMSELYVFTVAGQECSPLPPAWPSKKNADYFHIKTKIMTN